MLSIKIIVLAAKKHKRGHGVDKCKTTLYTDLAVGSEHVREFRHMGLKALFEHDVELMKAMPWP
jgi:hypothetical protein